MPSSPPRQSKDPRTGQTGEEERAPLRNASRARLRHFSKSLPMLLLRSRESVMQHFRRQLRQYDITEQQWRILRALVTAPSLEASHLASATFLLGPSLSRILRDLEKRKLIRRATDPDDARRARISIAPAGLALIEEISPFSEDIYRQITQTFGEERMRDLQSLLEALEKAMNEMTLTLDGVPAKERPEPGP